eukprot:2733395-Rhodomonas_salina.1
MPLWPKRHPRQLHVPERHELLRLALGPPERGPRRDRKRAVGSQRGLLRLAAEEHRRARCLREELVDALDRPDLDLLLGRVRVEQRPAVLLRREAALALRRRCPVAVGLRRRDRPCVARGPDLLDRAPARGGRRQDLHGAPQLLNCVDRGCREDLQGGQDRAR